MRQIPAPAALIALGCLFSGHVQAASLEVSPLTVSLAPGQTAATIEVTNHGGTPAALQARAFSWSQAGDEDRLAPTQEIILSPPIFTVPEGASQTVRLLFRDSAGSGGERSYRLLLDEVPPASQRTKQLVIALRISLPVIAASAAATTPALQWRTERGPAGQIVLTATNSGRSYDRVGAIEVTLADGSHPKVVPVSSNSYVLPGAQRHWTVQGSVPGERMRLSVTSLAGKSEQTLYP